MAIGISILVALPTVLLYLLRPSNATYLGIQYNLDDHMVYAGWMRQAMEGHILFENRFTTEQQPGLTLHVYFLVLGWIAKLIGIPVTMFVARIGLTALSVILLGRLVEFVTDHIYARKSALTIAVIGSGIGFLVWHNFGVAFTKPANEFLQGQLLSRLPTDVWQPEGFFFSSALTNGLFMVSTCLILGVLLNVLKAQHSKSAIVPGAICFGILMNIHSYDVLLLAFILLISLVGFFGGKIAKKEWIVRTLLIALGALPAALWFVYVLKNDPVFQARAATETFSPNFRSLIAGYSVLMLLALPCFIPKKSRAWAGVGLMVAMVIALWLIAPQHLADGYFMTPAAFFGCLLVVGASVFLIAPNTPGLTVIIAWAFVGLIAPYFPALFQRKLSMMLALPWGILAGIGISQFLAERERGQRNLATALAIFLSGATSVQWVARELLLGRTNVSNTTVHTVYLDSDASQIIEKLKPLGRNAVVLAYPGAPAPAETESGERIPDRYESPYISDMNPFVVGLAGSRTYAGHWSETPHYVDARNRALRAFASQSDPKGELLALGITHVIYPSTLNGSQVPAPQSLGIVEYSGRQLVLVKLQ